MSRSFVKSRAVRAVGASALMAGLIAGGYGVASAATGGSGTTHANSSAPHGLQRPGGPGGGRHGPGATITSIGTHSFTMKTPVGTTKTVNETGSTTYTRDGTTSAASALAVGEHVEVRPTQPSTNTSSTVTAAAVDILDPAVHGTVENVSGATLTIVDEQGFWRTINLSATTTYTNNGNSSSASALSSGETVVAFGTVDANHTSLDATSVAINPTHPGPDMEASPPLG